VEAKVRILFAREDINSLILFVEARFRDLKAVPFFLDYGPQSLKPIDQLNILSKVL
jgi:hypothetical protein